MLNLTNKITKFSPLNFKIKIKEQFNFHKFCFILFIQSLLLIIIINKVFDIYFYQYIILYITIALLLILLLLFNTPYKKNGIYIELLNILKEEKEESIKNYKEEYKNNFILLDKVNKSQERFNQLINYYKETSEQNITHQDINMHINLLEQDQESLMGEVIRRYNLNEIKKNQINEYIFDNLTNIKSEISKNQISIDQNEQTQDILNYLDLQIQKIPFSMGFFFFPNEIFLKNNNTIKNKDNMELLLQNNCLMYNNQKIQKLTQPINLMIDFASINNDLLFNDHIHLELLKTKNGVFLLYKDIVYFFKDKIYGEVYNQEYKIKNFYHKTINHIKKIPLIKSRFINKEECNILYLDFSQQEELKELFTYRQIVFKDFIHNKFIILQYKNQIILINLDNNKIHIYKNNILKII